MNSNNQQRPQGLSSLPTSEIALAPEFLESVKRIAPKRRRSKLWIVALLALAGAGGFFAWKRYWPRFHHVERPATAEPVASASAPLPVETASSSATASVATASATASAIPSATASDSAAPTVKMVKVRRRGTR